MTLIVKTSEHRDEIRSYGPGKFHTIIDSYVSEVSLDGGFDEELPLDDGSFYGFARIDDDFRGAVEDVAAAHQDTLTGEEQRLLRDTVAIFFHERSDGIVEVEWYDDQAGADDRWAEIEEHFAEDGEDDEEEEEEDEESDEDDVFSEEEMSEGYVIVDERGGGYAVNHEGKSLGSYDDMDAALDDIEAHMKRSNFYPNVYYVNDHGNIDLLDGDGNSIKSRV